MSRLQKQVVRVIREYDLFKANDRIILGISGGLDSVALLSLIFNINCVDTIYSEVTIAHLNHLLRGRESEDDEQFVRNLAKRFELPVIVERKDIKDAARRQKLSLEEVARKERYKFLESAALKVNANVIAVGHNADDNAETILHRIIRGTGILGVNGMRPKRRLTPVSKIELVRPLLFSWRKDVVTYLKEKQLSYRIDSTNFEKDKFRSKIRTELIPFLEKDYNFGIKKSLIKLGEITTQNYDFLKLQADTLSEKVFIKKNEEKDKVPGEVILDIHKLKNAPLILQQIIIREAIVRLGTPLREFGYENYKDILNLSKQKKTFINKGIKKYLDIKIEENKLYLSNKKYHLEEKPVLEEVVLKIPGDTDIIKHKYIVKMEVREIRNGFLEEFKKIKTKYDEAIDFSKINMPLTVRSRIQGDRFWPLGSRGIKKVKDFFIDNKIPLMERNLVPIVTMNGRPIWIVGFRIDDRVRITEETRKLLIMKFKRC